MTRSLLVCGASFALSVAPAFAQDPPPEAPPPQEQPAPQPTPQPAVGEVDIEAPRAEGARPGLFRLGPFWVTPTLQIGNVGLDTNVFYEPSRRQTDVTASGGPGLRILLPMRDFSLNLDGNLAYVYFVRTENQRRLTGGGQGTLAWDTGRTRVAVFERYQKQFQRPSFEVDERIEQERWATGAELGRRTVGKLGLRTELSVTSTDTPQGQTFQGADLSRTLSRDDRRAVLGLDFWVTPLSAVFVEGDYEQLRFPELEERDTDSNRVGLGIKTNALFTGQLLGGLRWLRPVELELPARRTFFAEVDLTLNISSKTRLGGSYVRDIGFSAFRTSGAGTLVRESYGARFEKDLIGNLDVRLEGRITRLLTDSEVTFEDEEGSVTAVRDDTAYQAALNIGYRFRESLRIGIEARYTERRSNIADFGIDGLLIGATIDYLPSLGIGKGRGVTGTSLTPTQ